MLKKAGIVVAAGAASLVAMSPLAFAGDTTENSNNDNSQRSVTKTYTDNTNNSKDIDKTDLDFQKGHNGGNVADKSGSGLINISGNNVNASPTTCGNLLSGNSIVDGALGGLFNENTTESAAAAATECDVDSATGDNFHQKNVDPAHHYGDSKGTK
ncbi:hypothetical protein WIS52_14205 [Pseudonocardia nematodicida]|uniref:Secreted protein n=1 Tax=Pseudonocardia nematodicida TaxID=1206997 RepID=A0ABV1KAX5_9PSEU